VSLQIWIKVWDSASSWTFTHAARDTQARVQSWTGVDNTTPSDVTGSSAFANQGGGTAGTVATAPTITIATANAQGIIGRGSWDGNAITAPAGWTERYDVPVLWVGDRSWTSTGATGSVAVNSGNTATGVPANEHAWGIVMGALRPASGATNYNGTATLAGTGSISATGVEGDVATATLAGTGAITATGIVGKVSTASLAGTGAITATGSVTSGLSGSATLAGTGSITATGVVGKAASVALAGTGAVIATGVVGKPSTATLAGTGAITATGTVGTSGALTGTATLAGTGTITATGVKGLRPTATLAGTGAISASGVVGGTGTAIDNPLYLSGRAMF
jgi:hypothetical protein